MSNNVDFSQRTADDSGSNDQAERIMRSMRQDPKLRYMPFWNDPVLEKRVLDSLRNELSGYDTTPHDDALLRQESEEKPFSSDEFWSDPEEQQKAAKQVRPRKL